MCKFGISFASENHNEFDVPESFIPARVHFGLICETVLVDQSMWAVNQYMSHWAETARRCLEENVNILFCSSLGEDNADLWVGIYGAEVMSFYNFVTPISDLKIEDLVILPKFSFASFVGELSSEWSRWEVPTSYLTCVAQNSGTR